MGKLLFVLGVFFLANCSYIKGTEQWRQAQQTKDLKAYNYAKSNLYNKKYQNGRTGKEDLSIIGGNDALAYFADATIKVSYLQQYNPGELLVYKFEDGLQVLRSLRNGAIVRTSYTDSNTFCAIYEGRICMRYDTDSEILNGDKFYIEGLPKMADNSYISPYIVLITPSKNKRFFKLKDGGLIYRFINAISLTSNDFVQDYGHLQRMKHKFHNKYKITIEDYSKNLNKK